MKERKKSLLILCDLSKVFDSVNHNILNNKLTKIRVDPFWFQDYLDDRCQKVEISNILSTTESVLWPIPSTIFIIDLAEEIHGCEMIHYADDTQFLYTGTEDALSHLLTATQTTLSSAKAYFNKNGLLINENKTRCIFIGSRALVKRIPNNITINFGNTHITPSKHIKITACT